MTDAVNSASSGIAAPSTAVTGAARRTLETSHAASAVANAAAGIVSYELFCDATQVQRPILERLAQARRRAAAAIDDGAAAGVLTRWVEATQRGADAGDEA